MSLPITFPDAAAVTIGLLTTGLADAGFVVPVVGSVPSPRPGEFVTVTRVGGARSKVRDLPLLAVECWADDKGRSQDIAQAALTVLIAAAGTQTGGVTVSRVDIAGGIGDLPDPTSGQPRHTFTVQPHLGAAA